MNTWADPDLIHTALIQVVEKVSCSIDSDSCFCFCLGLTHPDLNWRSRTQVTQFSYDIIIFSSQELNGPYVWGNYDILGKNIEYCYHKSASL